MVFSSNSKKFPVKIIFLVSVVVSISVRSIPSISPRHPTRTQVHSVIPKISNESEFFRAAHAFSEFDQIWTRRQYTVTQPTYKSPQRFKVFKIFRFFFEPPTHFLDQANFGRVLFYYRDVVLFIIVDYVPGTSKCTWVTATRSCDTMGPARDMIM